MILDAVLLAYLGISVYTDLKYRKVYNAAAIAAVILGAGLNCGYYGLSGLWISFTGIITGFAMLIAFYLLGGLGAGDVKFMAAVGCVKGAEFVLLGGLYGAVIGGLAGVIVLIAQKRLWKTLNVIFIALFVFLKFRRPQALKFETGNATYMPYTVFLSAGMLLRLSGMDYFLSGLTR